MAPEMTFTPLAYCHTCVTSCTRHEVTHVWQYASGVNVISGAMRALVDTGGRYTRAYHYVLARGRDLTDYGIEQQAAILEDYYLALARGPEAARFAGVLRRFLADPRYARRRPPS